MTPRLAFEDVSCLRGGRLLFERLSFALAPGEAALVSGANGKGKSSLIRIAAGLLDPAGGAVVRNGRSSWLGEASALDPETPLGDALAFWAALDGASREAVTGALDSVGLGDLAPVPVRLLSTGQRRRAGFARVLAGGAPIWLLDEPASGLDGAAVTRLEDAIAAHRGIGGIVVVATHQPLALGGAIEVVL